MLRALTSAVGKGIFLWQDATHRKGIMPRKKARPRVREAHAAEAAALGPAPEVEAQLGEPVTYVSERDWEILMDLIDNPPPPNEALIHALRHHRDFVRSFDHADED